MSDFHQNGVIATLHNFKEKRLEQIESDLLKFILKSKRIIKIIKKISGLKNIVLDNQMKCNTPKIAIT